MNMIAKTLLAGGSILALAAGSAQASSVFMPDAGSTYHRSALQPVSNNQTAGAENFISSMAQRGIDFLANPSISIEQRKAEFKGLLRDSFDMKTIGRFALGRYWAQATEAQKQEYLASFEKMIIEVYSKRFGDYKGQDFKVAAGRSEEGGDVIVTSHIIPQNGEKITVDWRVRNKNGGYKVVDVIVEGVSMATTQRSEFASVIQRGGGQLPVLLDHLRQH